jgi:hypothetical protein
MAESSTPKSWWEATSSHIVWGALVFTCFFVFVEKLVERDWGSALAALILGLGIAAVALHSKTWLERTNPNWAYTAALALVLALILSPFVEDKRWPFSAWSQSAPGPTAEEIAKAVVKALPTPQPGGFFNEATSKPAAPRSKQAINELLEETGKFQNPIEQAFPIMADWQSQIMSQNPQRMCLEPDFSRSLGEQVGAVANRLDSTQREVSSIYEANSIDGGEFNKIFGSLRGPGPNGYAVAAQALRNYSRDINPVMGRSIPCENLLKSINMLITFSNMTKALDQFSLWISEAKNNLSNYRNNLRKELRDAP